MKKIYTLLAAALLTAAAAQADNILTPASHIGDGTDNMALASIGDQVQDLAGLTSGYYVLKNHGGANRWLYENDSHQIYYSTRANVSNTAVVYINASEPTNNAITATIQAYSGYYYTTLTAEQTVTTAADAVDYTITLKDANAHTFLFQQGSNSINTNGDTNAKAAEQRWQGVHGQIEVYKANLGVFHTVTWNVALTYQALDGSEKTIDETVTTQVVDGADATAPTLSYPFATVTPKNAEETHNITADKTIDATATFNTPFEASTDFSNAHWYILKNASNNAIPYYKSDATDAHNVAFTTDEGSALGNQYEWAFIGNPVEGYTIFNHAAGESMHLYPEGGTATDNTWVILSSEAGDRWKLVAGKTDYTSAFSFKVNDVYLNLWGGVSNPNAHVGFWHDVPTNDAGSNWVVVKPKTGKYLKLQCTQHSAYLTSRIWDQGQNFDGRIMTEVTPDDEATAIWYYDPATSALVSYTAGKYLGNTSKGLDDSPAGDSVAIVQVPGSTDTYYIYFTKGGKKDYFWGHQPSGNEYVFSHEEMSSAPGGSEYKWKVEEVKSLPVTMHQSGDSYYATLSLPHNCYITSPAKAYGVTEVANGRAALTEVESTSITLTDFQFVKANEPIVIISETAGSVTARITDEPGHTVAGNLLKSTGYVAHQMQNNGNFYFGQLNGNAGFYQVNLSEAKYIVNKAYLSADQVSPAQAKDGGFTFKIDNATTGISSVDANAENNVGAAVRYNLAGQRVGNNFKGVVIQNGKKMLVK